MFDLKKTAAAALCLSGLAVGGMSTSAFAATTSASQTTEAASTAEMLATCGYQVVLAPSGLNVRSGPGTNFRIRGFLRNGSHTTGDCAAVRNWVHLSDQYIHTTLPKNARGWSFDHFLRKPTTTTSFCGYTVVRAPNGLFVRVGPGTQFRVIGALLNGSHTTGDCTQFKGWVHLSDKFIHYERPFTSRGWSSGHFLQK